MVKTPQIHISYGDFVIDLVNQLLHFDTGTIATLISLGTCLWVTRLCCRAHPKDLVQVIDAISPIENAA